MNYQKAFDSFMAYDFQHSCVKATMAGYSAEFLLDGSYRVLWNEFLDDYNSPGILIEIPRLKKEEANNDPDWNFYNVDANYYDRTEKEMRNKFEEAMKLLEN